jgi:aminopeptidase N
LRYVLGDSLFFRMIRRWLYPTAESERVTDGRQVRLVTTDEFVQHASRMARRDLRWFFEVYVRQPALPRLVEERTDTTLTLRWETPGQLPFPMPIDVEVNGTVRRWEMRGGSETRPVPRRATVRVDPGEWVFRRLTTSGA